MLSVPSIRVTQLTTNPPRADGSFVLYWMTAYRRHQYNFALQHAIDWANELKKPLVVLEAVRIRYRWTSDRFHRFILDGMVDNAAAFSKSKAVYLPYVEPQPGEGSGLVESLAGEACLTVSDDFPCFFHPTLYRRIASKWPSRIELVDSNGILPMRAADRTFTVAHSYRRFMQKTVPSHLLDFPEPSPLKKLRMAASMAIPGTILKRWPMTPADKLVDLSLDKLAIDHTVKPTSLTGGSQAARKSLDRFVNERLRTYSDDRNEPAKSGSSNLSPYLHFGHISPHEIMERLIEANGWNPSRLGKANGKMTGFWNMNEHSEAFLDQLLTWREIGFNQCWRDANYDRYESLPTWAQTTLAEHADDRREFMYTLEQFEASQTHDKLWNAAQRQLVRDGIIHNYLRMLWGKKILHWSESPQTALQIMIQLNNKYALDGRDPNSYSGIFWTLGRYDRAWGPERPIFGKIRYMTSESTQSKFRLKEYLAKFGE